MPDPRQTIAALRASHQRLVKATAGLGPDGVRAPSYDDDWSIAQVLSHLGSGAEIFLMMIGAVVEGRPMPGREAFPGVWAVWDAREPDEQATTALDVDGTFVAMLESLDDEQLALPVDLFGMDLDVGAVSRMRLSEHALHTWDIAVMADPLATVSSDAVDILIDEFGVGSWTLGKAGNPPLHLGVTTGEPARTFALATDEPVSLSAVPAAEAPTDATLALPAESLLRLIAGRLDADHTPATVSVTGFELDALRASFPGY